MARRRPPDSITWTAYRRAWALPVLALVILFATSFQVEAPVQTTLPPTLQNEQAQELLDGARTFDKRFADRRPGSATNLDSAQWMRDQFEQLAAGSDDLTVRSVPTTTTSPRTNRSVSLMNVEATLTGRTRELVVVIAHRDTADARGAGGDATGQLALLALAKELKSTIDRRRTYLFVSTDAATLNGAGSRALADRLAKRGAVVAVIVLDRLGAQGSLRVDSAPSGAFAPPLGLVQTARGAIGPEGGQRHAGSVLGQVAQLAMPMTLREHGQLLTQGLPAITLTRGDDQLRQSGDSGSAAERASDVGAGMRGVQRLLGTLDQVDQVQTAGKTWVSSDRRVYRGWALKIFIAALLIPVWVVVVDLFVRRRRAWNLLAIVGTLSRVVLAGIWAVGTLWLLGAVGLLARTGDRPPNPMAIGGDHTLGAVIWVLLVAIGWLIARGPDWRRSGLRTPTNDGDIVLSLIALVSMAVLALAINPFTVLFAIPSLHIWLALAAQPARSLRARVGVWCAGLVGPLLALLALGARSDLGLSVAPYLVQLVQTRTVPPLLGLLAMISVALAGLLLLAALGRVGMPQLPTVRRILVDFQLDPQRIAQRIAARARRVRAAIQSRRGASTVRTPKRLRLRAARTERSRRATPAATERATRRPAALAPTSDEDARAARRAAREQARMKSR